MISHSKFILKAPFNSLSFGQVSYNLARTMFEKGLDVSIFPISDNVDLSCFDKMNDEFFSWLKKSIENRYHNIDKNTPCIQLWHLKGSDSSPTSKSNLFTFHEIKGVTDTELSICKLHDRVIFSSSFSKDNFSESGCSNAFFAPIGFDKDLHKKDKEYLGKDIVHFILIGKWEARKNTELIIRAWVKLFGNKKQYRLTCLVDNPFFNKETMSNLISNTLGGKEYFNITFLPRLKTNSEMCDLYNSADIDLSGLSSGEGWNLPSFNSTCLGKWSCVLNCTSHMDWANKDNCILVEPTGLRDPYDNAFFRKGDEYNQGCFYNIDSKSIEDAMLKSLDFAKKPNSEGESLREKFSYDNTVDKLLTICEI